MDFSQGKVESLGHLGIIAATIKESGLLEQVDMQLGQLESGVRYSQRVAAMILNGLGFINTALYMTPRFFHDKPIDLLLGEGVSAEQLNDDCLGRCLDKIASYGTTKWYSEIALSMVAKAGLLSKVAYIDSTTLSLYGSYDQSDESVSPKPCLGYSKDHRPDLKQVTLQCVTMGKHALPIWMEALDGNSSDKKSFGETVKRVNAFYEKIRTTEKMCFIGDSALYGNQLEELNVEWLTRVPETYGECKSLCELRHVEWKKTNDDRYQIFSYRPQFKPERWILVRSEPAYLRESETFFRKHGRIFEEMNKSLWHCSCQTFGCEQDAKSAVDKIIRSKNHYYNVDYTINRLAKFSGKGRPVTGSNPDSFVYEVKINGIASDYQKILEKREVLGRFVLATNVLDSCALPDESMLFDYKDQGSIEQGFRFIKNDTLGLDEVYLKKPERIGALMAMMTLCLLIYGFAQYRLRDALIKNNEFLPNQKGKATQSPTLMWVFTLFSSISIIRIPNNDGKDHRIVMNLQPLHQKIILLFGETAREIYLLARDSTLGRIKLNQKTWLKWCGI